MSAAKVRSPIEHPASRIGSKNAHVLDAITQAYRQALRLVEDGHQLIGLQVGRRNPVIEILHSRRCAHLRGVWCRTGRDHRGGYRVMVSLLYPGIEVRWMERGH